MEINTLANISKQGQVIRELEIEKDKGEAEKIFAKILLQEMIKGMYKTTKFEEKETKVEQEFYQEIMADILSDKIIESKTQMLSMFK